MNENTEKVEKRSFSANSIGYQSILFVLRAGNVIAAIMPIIVSNKIIEIINNNPDKLKDIYKIAVALTK